MRRSLAVWAAVVLPTWAVLIVCSANAPVVFDTWTPYLWWRAHPLSLHTALDAARGNYVWGNPRLGHFLGELVSLSPYNAIALPLVELATFYLAASLALGRWASPRRANDALVLLVTMAMIAGCAPLIGPMLFYQPYTANYVLGLAFGLAFLAPYRFAPDARIWLVPVTVLLGAAAGLCNEHTAPAIGLLAVAATLRVAITHRRLPPAWMIAGVVGFIAGAAALYLAPGQNVRYGGLARQHTALELVASRGIAGAAHQLLAFVRLLVWLVPWLALAALQRWRTRRAPAAAEPDAPTYTAAAAFAIAALVVVATLLGSPKLGARLYFAPVVLACIAAADVVARHLRTSGVRAAAAVLASAVVIYTGWRCVAAYRVLGPESEARMATLEHAAPGTTVTVPAFSVRGSRYSLGDDLTDEPHRRMVAQAYGLLEVRVTGLEPGSRAPTP